MDTIKFLLVSVVGKKFEKKDNVSLDNTHFANCSFEGCVFVFSGGPVIVENCQFENCGLKIQGAAGILLQSLIGLGFQIIAPPGFEPDTSFVN